MILQLIAHSLLLSMYADEQETELWVLRSGLWSLVVAAGVLKGGADGCRYLIVVGIVLGVLLLQELPLSPLLLQRLLDQRRHLALLARTLSANHKPALQKPKTTVPALL